MRTAISSIAYLRNLFPEDCFQERKLTGLTIRSLLPNKPEAMLLINWLERGVFDALDRNYLSDVIFAVYAKGEKKNTLLECYQFHVDYPESSSTDDNNSPIPGMFLPFNFDWHLAYQICLILSCLSRLGNISIVQLCMNISRINSGAFTFHFFSLTFHISLHSHLVVYPYCWYVFNSTHLIMPLPLNLIFL